VAKQIVGEAIAQRMEEQELEQRGAETPVKDCQTKRERQLQKVATKVCNDLFLPK
jgi:hypothetical protein